MHRLKVTLLALTALIFGSGGLFLWLRLGNDAAAPALLGILIAVTCLFRILSFRGKGGR